MTVNCFRDTLQKLSECILGMYVGYLERDAQQVRRAGAERQLTCSCGDVSDGAADESRDTCEESHEQGNTEWGDCDRAAVYVATAGGWHIMVSALDSWYSGGRSNNIKAGGRVSVCSDSSTRHSRRR